MARLWPWEVPEDQEERWAVYLRRREGKLFLTEWRAAGQPLPEAGTAWLAQAVHAGLRGVVDALLKAGAQPIGPERAIEDDDPALRPGRVTDRGWLARYRQATESAYAALFDATHRPLWMWPAQRLAADLGNLNALNRVQPLMEHPHAWTSVVHRALVDETLPLVQAWCAKHGDTWVRSCPDLSGNPSAGPYTSVLNHLAGWQLVSAPQLRQTRCWVWEQWALARGALNTPAELARVGQAALMAHDAHGRISEAVRQHRPEVWAQLDHAALWRTDWTRLIKQWRRAAQQTPSHYSLRDDERDTEALLQRLLAVLRQGTQAHGTPEAVRNWLIEADAHVPDHWWPQVLAAAAEGGMRWRSQPDCRLPPQVVELPERWPALQRLGWDPNEPLLGRDPSDSGSVAWVIWRISLASQRTPGRSPVLPVGWDEGLVDGLWQQLTELGVDWRQQGAPHAACPELAALPELLVWQFERNDPESLRCWARAFPHEWPAWQAALWRYTLEQNPVLPWAVLLEWAQEPSIQALEQAQPRLWARVLQAGLAEPWMALRAQPFWVAHFETMVAPQQPLQAWLQVLATPWDPPRNVEAVHPWSIALEHWAHAVFEGKAEAVSWPHAWCSPWPSDRAGAAAALGGDAPAVQILQPLPPTLAKWRALCRTMERWVASVQQPWSFAHAPEAEPLLASLVRAAPACLTAASLDGPADPAWPLAHQALWRGALRALMQGGMVWNDQVPEAAALEAAWAQLAPSPEDQAHWDHARWQGSWHPPVVPARRPRL